MGLYYTTMKKTYNTPETLITRVNVERMVASSPQLKDTNANQGFGMDTKQRGDWDIWGSQPFKN